MDLDLGLEYTGGIRKPTIDEVGYIAVVDDTGLNVEYLAPGSIGIGGGGVLSGSGVPAPGLGTVGEFYLDYAATRLYGPKSGGGWGAGVSLIGASGTNGTNGFTVRNGTGSPSSGIGVNGDFYIDTTAHSIYGPKTAGAWGAATTLVGPTGSTGSTGATGSTGSTGAAGANGLDGNKPVNDPGVDVTFATTAGNVDATAYTIPGSPTGSGRFILTMVAVRVKTAIVGTGTVNIRVGTTTGANDICTDQPVTNGTTVGTIVEGQQAATLGTLMTAGNLYTLAMNAGDVIKIRAATTGTLSAGACTIYVYGVYLP